MSLLGQVEAHDTTREGFGFDQIKVLTLLATKIRNSLTQQNRIEVEPIFVDHTHRHESLRQAGTAKDQQWRAFTGLQRGNLAGVAVQVDIVPVMAIKTA